MRADAVRNRERIVELARALFREKGYDAVSMDEVAKAAEVGVGTLYRHFPTKEALYDAALQAWVETVTEAVEKALAAEGSARDRLLSWFDTYVEFLTRHKGAAWRITSALGDEGSPFAAKCRTYLNANQRIIDTLASEGAMRADVDAMQLCRLVGGVAAVVDNSELDAEAARSMLAVVADGVLAS
ncbi:TetR/AcrR family transcriptional regulator [Nocardioides humilatus]|uniref:TetR/AcrR family transcriptional regulator n=1 Tax=Nocardioides humilatus TaxID=2607660 RepID=A0A5B1LMU9_9ACTN|nr:TetR/AcrR family transcriptional regulator [Nocardioides humilatus]KAA1421418.1 TetR/AcrR family transcriptional regulator [Nocardioides humilatus]